jgi:peptidoglycan biosynthesis protein MviN/MurJ (putative lipid II flippase)
MLTLTGYAIQEVATRSFYARKEPYYPLYGVVIRLVVYLAIGITAVMHFKDIGAPMIAFAEIAALFEAIFLFNRLGKRMGEAIIVRSAVSRGLIAALIGGVTTFGVMMIAPVSPVIAALSGLTLGGVVGIPIIWSEIKLLLNL